jgi:purine-binding chemotaxis protein CheW
MDREDFMTIDAEKFAEHFVLFQLAQATYGLRSRDVRQVEMVESVTPVPSAPPFVEGLVLSRGQVIPAINLRVRFGFEKTPFTLQSRLVIARAQGRTVGLIVDSAREFVSIAQDSIVAPPEEISGLSGRYLEGIVNMGERLILILNVAEVLQFDGEESILMAHEGSADENREDG